MVLTAILCLVAVLAQAETEAPVVETVETIEPLVIDNHVPSDYQTFCEFLVENDAATEFLDLNNCNGDDRRRLAEEQFPDANAEAMTQRDEDKHFIGTQHLPGSASGRRNLGDPAFAPEASGVPPEGWRLYNSAPPTKILVHDDDWWYVYWGCSSEHDCQQLALYACGCHCTIAAESGCTNDARGTRQQAMNYYHPSSFDYYHWNIAQDRTDRAIYMTCDGGFGYAYGYGSLTDYYAWAWCGYYNGHNYCEKVDRSAYVHAHHSVDNMEHHESQGRRELWMIFWNDQEMVGGSYPEVERQGSMECEIYSSRWLYRYMARNKDYFVPESSLPSVETMKEWQITKEARDTSKMLKLMLYHTNAQYVRESHWYWGDSLCHQWSLETLPTFTKNPYGWLNAVQYFRDSGIKDLLHNDIPVSISVRSRSDHQNGLPGHDMVLVGYQYYGDRLQWLRLADPSAEENGKTVWKRNGKYDEDGVWIENYWEKTVYSIGARYIKASGTFECI